MKRLARRIVRMVPHGVRRWIGAAVVDRRTRRFIRHNREAWAGWHHDGARGEILVDVINIPQTLIAYSYFVNVLARTHQARIRPFATGKWDTAFNPDHLALPDVYRSFNAGEWLSAAPSAEQRRRAKALTADILRGLRTKRDVLDLTVFDVWLGIDVYQTYLARFRKPTVALDDPKLAEVVEEGVGLALFWKEYFDTRKIAAVVVSHDCYLEYGVVSKVAHQRRVPVYLPSIRRLARVERPYAAYEHFAEYPEMFRSLTAEQQEAALRTAREQLERRWNGEVGVNMPYATASAFHRVFSAERVLKQSDKVKVLIATHCFYDNPHAYGGLLFADFFEWLRYLGEISERTDYDWYLKVHPDPLPGTEDVIREILRDYPRIRWIPHETSHHQLIAEGIDVVLTAYGTVGHEYPAFGVQVVNAGYNPRIAYDFNWHPKTLDEYEHYLLSLPGLRKDVDPRDLHEFYYMHHLYCCASDLFLDSYWTFVEQLSAEDQIGPAAYGYFLDRLSPAKHERIVAEVQRFIDSGKRNYFSRGPE